MLGNVAQFLRNVIEILQSSDFLHSIHLSEAEEIFRHLIDGTVLTSRMHDRERMARLMDTIGVVRCLTFDQCSQAIALMELLTRFRSMPKLMPELKQRIVCSREMQQNIFPKIEHALDISIETKRRQKNTLKNKNNVPRFAPKNALHLTSSYSDARCGLSSM